MSLRRTATGNLTPASRPPVARQDGCSFLTRGLKHWDMCICYKLAAVFPCCFFSRFPRSALYVIKLGFMLLCCISLGKVVAVIHC